jgi:hypothetical protein
MSDSESDMSGIEEVIVTPPVDPKPVKKSKTKKSKSSNTKEAENARKKRQEELEDTIDSEPDKSDKEEEIVKPKKASKKASKKAPKTDKKPKDAEKPIDDDDSSSNETCDSDSSSNETTLTFSEMVTKVNKLEELIAELIDRIEDSGNRLSGKKGKAKPKAKPKVKKTLSLIHMTARDVQTLIESEKCWGDYDKPEDHKEASKLFSKKPKLPSEICNLKLREFVENALTNEDLMDQLDITLLDDDKITTHIVTKIVKNHCKENDSIITEEVSKDDGKVTKRTCFNLTEGDFEDMFQESVSS